MKFWRMLIRGSCGALILCLILLGFGVRASLPATVKTADPTSQSLMDLRSRAIWVSRTISADNSPRALIYRQDIETAIQVWNAAGKNVILGLHASRLDAPAVIIARPVQIFDWTLYHISRVSFDFSTSKTQARVRLGWLPIPDWIWKPVIARRNWYGIDGAHLLHSWDSVGSVIADKKGWYVPLKTLRGGREMFVGLLARLSVVNPNRFIEASPLGPSSLSFQDYLERIKALNKEPSPEHYPLADLFKSLFSHHPASQKTVVDGATYRAGLAALSAVVLPGSVSKILYGDVERLTWTAHETGPRKRRYQSPLSSRLEIAGRRDLVKHFALGAALELLAGEEDTTFAGVLKEVSDDGRGGSGFDRDDILANAAGQVAARALSDPEMMNIAAHCLSHSPDLFLPNEADLHAHAGAIWSLTSANQTANTFEFVTVAQQLQTVLLERLMACGRRAEIKG